jgi:hypothetical protein
MPAGTDRRRPAPSNAKLAERTGRIEERVEHIDESVTRIEEKLDEDLDELAETVEKNEKRAGRFWEIYRFSRWGIPLLVSAGTAGVTYLIF